MADRLAERRKQAQRAEAQADAVRKQAMVMARKLDEIKSDAYADGFRDGIIEAQRMAWSAGTIGRLRESLSALRTRLDTKRRERLAS